MIQISSIKNTLIVCSVSIFLCSCGDSKKDEIDEIPNTTTETKLDSQKISAQNVFNAIPGRKQIIDLTSKAQAEYNAEVLNNPDNVNKYSLESTQALNLGTYGSDLNVTGVFEQTQESMLFLKCVNMLAKDLGVSSAFDEKMVDRMTVNKDNRDSTMEIISQSFKKADTYLKENGRPGTSSLIVAGAWIEGVYIACNTAKETKSEDVVKEIFSQTESLKYLIELLDASKINQDAGYIISDLKNAQTIFTSKTDGKYTLEALVELDKVITALRTRITTSK